MNGVDKILGSIQHGWYHSTARFLLLLSCLLVLFAFYFSGTQRLLETAFLTFYCALTYYWLTTLRKHESLGKYVVGSHKGQVVLYTLITIFLFLFWASSTWAIITCTVDRMFGLLLVLGALVLLLSIVWLFLCLYNLCEFKFSHNVYKADVWCRNCCSKTGEYKIIKGYLISETRCPNCGTESLVHITNNS
jgi:hypothetical protein